MIITTIIMTVTCDPAVVSGDLSEQPTRRKREETEVAGSKPGNENSLEILIVLMMIVGVVFFVLWGEGGCQM